MKILYGKSALLMNSRPYMDTFRHTVPPEERQWMYFGSLENMRGRDEQAL